MVHFPGFGVAQSDSRAGVLVPIRHSADSWAWETAFFAEPVCGVGSCGTVRRSGRATGLGEVCAVSWGEYVDGLVAALRRDGGSGQSLAEALAAAADAVAGLIGGSEARHVRVAAMRLAFVRERVGLDHLSRVPADVPASALLLDALRLVAAAHDALRVGVSHEGRGGLLAQVRARVQLRAAYDALSRERAQRLETAELTSTAELTLRS
jgi:hypothetical protein